MAVKIKAQIDKIGRWFTEPTAALQDYEDRLSARWTAGLTIIIFLLSFATLTFPLIRSGKIFISLPHFFAAIGLPLMFLVAYLLTRVGKHRQAIMIAAATVSLLAFALALSKDLSDLHYLLMPVLVVSAFLSTRAVWFIACVDTAGVLLIPILEPTISLNQVTLEVISFFVIGFALVLTISHYRERLKQHRVAQVSQTNEVLQALHEVALNISTDLAFHTLLERAATRAADLLDADSVAIFLYQSETHELQLIEATGFMEACKNMTFKPGEGIGGRVFQTGQPLIMEDHESWGSASEYAPPSSPIILLGVPLLWRDHAIGVLFTAADPQRRTFGPDDVSLAEMLAAQMTVAIRNAQLYQELETYSGFLEQKVETRTAELRRVKERVEAILNNSPDAILLLDGSGKISLFNSAFHDLFGYDADEVQGQAPAMLAAPAYAKAFDEAHLMAVAQGQPGRLEIVALRKGRQPFDVDAAFAPVWEEDVVAGVICSLRDISALKEVERMKDDFILNVSHQFRTPITSIQLSMHLLERETKTEQGQRYLGMLRNQTERLGSLVKDITELLWLTNNRQDFMGRPISIDLLVRDAVSLYQDRAKQKSLTLSTAPIPADLPLVIGDEDRLIQALGELVENAVLFTPDCGQISITVTTEHVDGQPGVAIAVQDTGPGIAPEEQALIFNRFYRGAEQVQTGHIPGTGLGLAIVKTIVDLHKGSIHVTNETSAGATFILWLPAAETSRFDS